MKATGADAVLIDPNRQAHLRRHGVADCRDRQRGARRSLSPLELMRHWYQSEHLPFTAFVSQDGLHMNDWSYAFLAKALGKAIAEAMTRHTGDRGRTARRAVAARHRTEDGRTALRRWSESRPFARAAP
jgi:hypothetical protein